MSAKILVAEDSPTQAEAFRMLLEQEGHVVDVVANGRDGLARVRSDPPDLIISDVRMPEADGYAFCAGVKASEQTRAIPFVMLTDLQERTDKIRALEAGADDFLSKPIDRPELLARVRSLLRAKSLHDDLTRSRDEVARHVQQLAAQTRRAERERATLDALMTSMSDGLAVMDTEQRLIYCNGRAPELLGADLQSCVGRAAREALAAIRDQIVDPDDAWVEWMHSLDGPDGRPSVELGLKGPPRRDVLLQSFPIASAAGEAIGVGIVARDVTREREADRLKDELMAVVSHELRTPLASLVGFAELLLDRENDEEERREFLEIILAEGRRLTELINDFLDLQRLESGRQIVVTTPLNLRPTLERAVAAAADDPARPITLRAPARLPAVSADEDRILQVLANLLSNARKFSPAGGVIDVSATVVEEAIQVSVRDEGLGIPPEALPRLFQKFFRVDNSDRREIKGTGLGLAICREIVEAHGGRIWAESDGLGHGARVRFTLPLAARRRSGADVLVVEDDAAFSRLMEEELASRRLTAVRAPTAEVALERLAVESPRAVILDLLLPGLPGEAFLPLLREAKGADLPVVVVTVKDLSAEEHRDMEQLGVVAFLRKGARVAAEAARTVSELVAKEAKR